jgi:hypothetical protein
MRVSSTRTAAASATRDAMMRGMRTASEAICVVDEVQEYTRMALERSRNRVYIS